MKLLLVLGLNNKAEASMREFQANSWKYLFVGESN